MNLVACLLAGAMLGWAANYFMQGEHPRGLTNSLLMGVSGALVGNWVASPAADAGLGHTTVFSTVALVVSAVSAIALLAVMHLVRRVRAD